MEAVTGVFHSRPDAERAIDALQTLGLAHDQITLLTPGHEKDLQSVPVVAGEQPGMAKGIGAVVGGSAGLSALPLIAAIIPGVGAVAALGILGSAVLAAAGAKIGSVVGGKLENSMTPGLPEDEIFVYEDALRKGQSVVIAIAKDDSDASRFRELLKTEGADAVDAARDQWWIGLRDAEREKYSSLAKGKDFGQDEKYYRLGFEAALHARTRCQEFDQSLSEMAVRIEDLQRQHPGEDVEDPFRRGYERGREYYQTICESSKAA